MRNLYQATSKAVRLNSSKGFTLIELLVVIAIIAILASLAIPQYLRYQRKAKVSSYAEPIARGCMMDIAAFCMENPTIAGQQTSKINADGTATITPTAGNPTTITLRNCNDGDQVFPSAGGNVTLQIVNAGNCTEDGQPPKNIQVIATLPQNVVPDFRAVCSYPQGQQSVRCTVETQ